MNGCWEPAYSNEHVGLKKVGDLLTTSDQVRQQGCSARKWRQCSFVFFMCMESFIMNSYHRIRQQRRSFRLLTSTNYASAYHDNAPAHSSLMVCEYFWWKKIFPRCHTLLFLFTKLKSVLKGTWFDDLEEIKANTTRVLKALTSSDFKSCLKVWKKRRWNKCVILGGGGELLWVYWNLVRVKLLNLIF